MQFYGKARMFRKSAAMKKEGAEVFISLTFLFLLFLLALGKLSSQLVQHMVAGVLRSEVWLSVHVPEPNYSLISTQVAPTVHSNTGYSHYSLISAVKPRTSK